MVNLGGLGDKAKQFLDSDKGEQTSDAALDRARDLANKLTGDKHADKIESARDAADRKLGNR